MGAYISIARADGGVTIMSIPDTATTPDGITVPQTVTSPLVEHHIAKWALTANPEWLPVMWRPVAREDIPPSVLKSDDPLRIYRNALVDDGQKLSHDLEKAKGIAIIINGGIATPKITEAKTLSDVHAALTE